MLLKIFSARQLGHALLEIELSVSVTGIGIGTGTGRGPATRRGYLVELFVRAPEHKCNAAPELALHVVDRNGALIDGGLDAGTQDTINWQKVARTDRLAAGQYAIALKAAKWCDVNFRVRISPTLADQ